MTASIGFHEPVELLSQESMDRHRALASLQEELEAIDWYSQRIEAAQDSELRDVLRHNRDEEVEHAAMVLEWIRRRDPVFERELSSKLFAEGPITKDEANDEPAGEENGPGDGRLGIGSLRSAGAEKVGE